jgi:hypothetical protein
MAATVNNLRVNNLEVKNIVFTVKKDGVIVKSYNVKEFQYNTVIVWKSSNLFYFVTSESYDPSTAYDPDTYIFVGFNEGISNFEGEYKSVETSAEVDNTTTGTMYVVNEEKQS